MRVVVYQEKKFVKERERVCQTNLSTLMNIYNMHIFPIQIHMRKLELGKKKKKKKSRVQKRFYGKTISEYILVLKF